MSMDGRFAPIENRLPNIEIKFDTRFNLPLSKVVHLDNRPSRIEARGHQAVTAC
jgi:hypothetical protein